VILALGERALPSARARHASSAACQATADIFYGSKISRSLRCAGHVADFTTLPPTRRLSSSLPVKVVAIRPLDGQVKCAGGVAQV
jgi:hypothetical protein